MYRNYSITPLHSSGIGNKVVHLNTRTPSYTIQEAMDHVTAQ